MPLVLTWNTFINGIIDKHKMLLYAKWAKLHATFTGQFSLNIFWNSNMAFSCWSIDKLPRCKIILIRKTIFVSGISIPRERRNNKRKIDLKCKPHWNFHIWYKIRRRKMKCTGGVIHSRTWEIVFILFSS